MIKNTIYILFSMLIISHTIHAQTIKKLIKTNTSKACDCMDKIDYIDSRADFEVKFSNCTKLTKKDSIQIQEKISLKDYEKLLFSELFDNCVEIESKLEALRKSYILGVNDSIYSLEKPSQEIQEKIIGAYSLAFGHHSPEGSSKLFILDNNTYVMMGFGTVVAGSWHIVREKYLHLNPYKTKYPFYVYGRYNPEIGDATKTVFIGGDFSHETLIHYGKISNDQPVFAPILNIDANCLSYPKKVKMKKTFNEISLAYNKNLYYNEVQENKMIDIYQYKNSKNFNDFIVYELNEKNNARSTRVIIDDDGLMFRENKVAKRFLLPEKTTDNGIFIRESAKQEDIPNYIYYNLGYKKFESDTINEQYLYNSKLNTYDIINKKNRSFDALDDYDNFLRVNKYERLKNVTKQKKQFKLAEKSIIYKVCD